MTMQKSAEREPNCYNSPARTVIEAPQPNKVVAECKHNDRITEYGGPEPALGTLGNEDCPSEQ